MNSLIRLIWVYLNRCPESSTSTRKRLETILGTCFNGNLSLYPSELPLEPFVAILHYVMVRKFDYGVDFVAHSLGEGVFERHGGIHSPTVDRATAVVQAIHLTLITLQQERSATWPQSSDFNKFSADESGTVETLLIGDDMSKPDIADFLLLYKPVLMKLLFGCDMAVGSLIISNDATIISTHASSAFMDGGADQLTRKHEDVHVSYASRNQPLLCLFSAILDALPHCLPQDVDFNHIANILCRATFSADPALCTAAGRALRRIAEDKTYCLQAVNTYIHFIFETRHVFRDTFVGSRLLESQFERVIRLLLDLVQVLVAHHGTTSVTTHDTDQPTSPVSIATIEKFEGCALYLLCSTSLPLRRLASRLFIAAQDLHGQSRGPSAAFRYSRISPEKSDENRVNQLYEKTWDAPDCATMRSLPWCTASDRIRLDLATSKENSKLMQRIAESDNPKDSSLWLSLLPFFVGRVVETLPGSSQQLHNLVSATVLRLQGHVSLVASGHVGRPMPGPRQNPAVTRSSSDMAALADHWRSYLAILCVTMPIPQSGPTSPPVQRTRDAIILTPDTISSPALLHYLITGLAWEDTRFKDAAVYALGAITQAHFRALSEILLGVVRRLADGTKIGGTPRENSHRPSMANPLWTAVAHVFRLISSLVLDSKSSSHLANLASMIGFVKVTFAYLSDRAVKAENDLQTLRRSFCIVVENLTNALARLDAADRFFGEETRGAIFMLCYDWCQIGRRPDVIKAREAQLLQAAANSNRSERDRAQYLDDLQAKMRLLSAASADAMAGLCVSPPHKP